MGILKEGYIESECCKIAKKLGWQNRKISFQGQVGAPDRIFFRLGDLIWVEFKTKGGVISEMQKYQQEQLEIADQKVFNVYSVEQFIDILGGSYDS